jgi:hypothetical protein
MLTFGEMLNLAWTARDPSLFAAFFFARLSPTVRDRREIRAAVGAALRGEDALVRFGSTKFWRNWRVNRGANVMINSTYTGNPASFYEQSYPWQAIICHPVNMAYFERILKLAEENGIVVWWVLPPALDELQAICDRSGLDAQFTQFVRGFQARHANLNALDGRQLRLGREFYFSDPCHLNRDGGITLSASISQAFSRGVTMGGQDMRWVTLVPDRWGRFDGLIEDVNESAMAMTRQALRR